MKRFAASVDSETDENIWETVEDAYVYAFPLVLMDATETSATNTEEVVTKKAPVNQFIHSVALADAQFRTVVTPNVDTIYSQVWYDLSEEPMVYELPKTDRFCKVQVLDGWTNTAAVLDKNRFIRRRGSPKCVCHPRKNETYAAFRLYIRRHL